MIRIVRSSIRDVVQHLFSIQTVPLSNREETLRTECPLRVDVETLALSSFHINGELHDESQWEGREGRGGEDVLDRSLRVDGRFVIYPS